MIRHVHPNESWLWDGLVALFVLTLLVLTLISRALLLGQIDRAALVRDAQATLDRTFQQDVEVALEFNDYHQDGNPRFLARAVKDEASRVQSMTRLRTDIADLPSTAIASTMQRLAADDAAAVRVARLVPGASPSPAFFAAAHQRRADLLALRTELRSIQTVLDQQTRAAIVWVSALAVPVAVLGVGLIVVTRRQRTTIRRQREELHTMHRLSELYTIADLVDVLQWSAAPDGTITYLSRRWVDVVGRPIPEMLVRGWLDAIHPDDRDETARRWTSALSSGRPYQVEHRIQCGDGAYRWFRTLGVPLRDADERVISWFGSASDIDHMRRRVTDFQLPGPHAGGEVVPFAEAEMPSFDEILFETSRPSAADDWCDVFGLPDGRIFLSIGLKAEGQANPPLPDIRDARRAIATLAHGETDPGTVLDRFNAAALMRRTGCVAVMCGYVNRATYELVYATAGHEGPYLGEDDGVRALAAGGPPIGMYAGASYSSHLVRFGGDLVVVVNRLARDQQPAQQALVMDALRSAKANGSRAAAIGERVRNLREDDENPIVLTIWGAPTTLGVTR